VNPQIIKTWYYPIANNTAKNRCIPNSGFWPYQENDYNKKKLPAKGSC